MGNLPRSEQLLRMVFGSAKNSRQQVDAAGCLGNLPWPSPVEIAPGDFHPDLRCLHVSETRQAATL